MWHASEGPSGMMDRNNARSVTQENRRTGGTTLSVCQIPQRSRVILQRMTWWNIHDLRVVPDNFFRPAIGMRNQFHTLTGVHRGRGIQFEPSIRIPYRSIQSQERVVLSFIHPYNTRHTRSETAAPRIHRPLLIIIHENSGTLKRKETDIVMNTVVVRHE